MKKSSKRNGQEFEPPYQFWHEREFWSDEYVSRGMTYMQRHLYRALLQAAFHCSTRPYLPNDDDKLWLLADAGSKENWMQNREAVLKKFEVSEDGALLMHRRLQRDWILLIEYHTKRVKAGSKGGKAKAKKTAAEPDEEGFIPQPDIDENAV
jgi:uncharacterized protein YdaU (DUF1376 family)